MVNRRADEAKVAVVGSANTDMVVRVDRLPRAGKTVVGGDLVLAGGGKGANQAIAARRLGAEVYFVARLGADAFGDQALDAYRSAGLHTEYVLRTPEVPSGVALIVVDERGENQIAVAPGANVRLTPSDVTAAELAVAASAVVVVQLEIPLATVEAAVTLARRHDKTVVLNPAPAPFERLPESLLAEADVLNPNRHEASALTGITVEDRASAERAGRALLGTGASSRPRAVIITLGGDGAMIVTPDVAQHVPAVPVTSVDTTGAGDAFTAGLAVGLARQMSLVEAVRVASVAGALATTRLGAQPSMPWWDEVEELLARRPLSP